MTLNGIDGCRVISASILSAVLLFSSGSSIQATPQSIGNGALMSGLTAGVAFRDPFAAVNPSGAGSVRGSAVSIWMTRPFNISDIKILGLSGMMSIGGLGIAPRFRAFGFDEYQEYQLSVQIGFPISREMEPVARLGFGIQAHSKKTASDGFVSSFVVRTGFLIPVAPNMDLGGTLSRSMGGTIHRSQSALFGFAFRIHEETSLYLDVFSEKRFRPSYRLGVSTTPVYPISVQFGASTYPEKLSAGISVRSGPISGSVAVEYHMLLGTTTTIETTILPASF